VPNMAAIVTLHNTAFSLFTTFSTASRFGAIFWEVCNDVDNCWHDSRHEVECRNTRKFFYNFEDVLLDIRCYFFWSEFQAVTSKTQKVRCAFLC
jgi:hypothetical protein